VVDFRRCVIVLTSNVGSSIAHGPGLGFDRAADPFSPEAVERAVTRSFRPEFLNRLDRVVVFRPLGREQMRALLDLELRSAAARRGLRGRPWAIEYDESALEFLIDQGFSPHLGARPLKRAVEQHFLAPLATAIVDRTIPEGDQFLFVTAPKGKIEVRFVDPDLDDASPAEEVETREHDLDLRSAVLSPRPDPALAAFLLDELQRIRAAVDGPAVRGRKESGLEAISQPGFWEDDGRFGVLADVEYLDRLEAALDTADKLGARLRSQTGRNGQASTEIVDLLATRLYVLDAAVSGLGDGAAHEVVLRLRPVGDAGEEVDAFVEVLAGMYRAWAERRGMRLEPVAEQQATYAVSGLGAGAILAPESGLHVLEVVGEETREGDRPVDRVAVAVEVASSDSGTPAPESASTDIVRRYRPGASPLVRDAVRGYRTGRLDRVLAGDFDLF
jgi:ATP-dependent Clp protease ATP-binding subunit ClpC